MQAILNWFWTLVPANPMVVRVVQGGSQRMRHMWVRMAYLGVLCGIMMLALLSTNMGSAASLSDLAKAGTKVFELISYGQIILVCLLAPLFMAGAIAAERSGETYNILLTTPLTNLQIVLGSLFGRLTFVLFLLFSGLPLFAVLLIFGGVRTHSVFVAFATAALVSLVVGSVAVTLSVFRAGGRKAVFTFIISIAAYLVLCYALDVLILRDYAVVKGTTTWVTPLHPILVLESYINRANYRPPTPEELVGYSSLTAFYLSRPFATFAIISTIITSVLMLTSAVVLRQIGTGESNVMARLRQKLRLGAPAGSGAGAQIKLRPAREVWHNPIAWREANTRGNSLGAILGRWGFLFIAMLATGILLALYHNGALPTAGDTSATAQSSTFRNIFMTFLVVEIAVIVLVAIYMSAGAVSREREDGTLDLMLTTPITPKYYIWGKLRGLVSFLTMMIAAPAASLALVVLYTIVGLALDWPTATITAVTASQFNVTATVPLLYFETPLIFVIILVPFIALCVAVGMNWSLKSKGVLSAVIPTIAIIGLLSLVLGFCGLPAAENIPFIGTVINAFSPVTSLYMLVNPVGTINEFARYPAMGRISMFIAALTAAGGYSAIVYGTILNMVRGFDQTVRKLSGTA